MTTIDDIMNYIELAILCVVALTRFIGFCYYPSADSFFMWLFILAYEMLLGLGFLKVGFLTKLFEQEFPFAIHRLPRSIALIIIFFI